MRSPQPSTVVIACPHCGTRYQVPPETLGATGRKVSCAHCGKAWLAEGHPPPPPEEDRLFSPDEEEALDREFTAIEQRASIAEVAAPLRGTMPDGGPPPEVVRSIAEIKAAIAPRTAAEPPVAEPPPTPEQKVANGKLEKRQRAAARKLPAARLFRVIRIGAVLLLCALIAGGLIFRTEIVKVAPEMAGVYAALGLGVNVVGLEFTDVSTLMSRRGDSEVISVTAKIRGVEPRRVVVPPVVVSLLDAEGASIYQWSVVPPASDVEPGEAIDFSAELAGPPKGATQLRLGFAGGRPHVEATAAMGPQDNTQATEH